MMTTQTQETPIITSENGGNVKFTKIALIALTVAFLIIISVTTYFIFAKNEIPFINFGETAQQEESEHPTDNLPLRSIILPSQAIQKKDISVDSNKARVFADMLDSLASNNKLDPSDIAIIYYEISGTVLNSDSEEREIDGINYVYRLLIKKHDGSIMTYRLTEENIADAIILLITLPESSEISITDIKPGDIIVAKTTIDLLDASSHSNLILEIRRQR